MLAKIKLWLMAGLAIAASVLYALFQSERAGRARDKLKGSENARKVEKKATDALVEGLENEQKVRDEKVDTTKRTHFE